MTTIKRFTPDYKMHAVRFEAFAREAEHGELVRFDAHQQVVSALKAECDAQQKRADALAVENAAMRHAITFATAPDMWIDKGYNHFEYRYQEWYVDVLNAAADSQTSAALAAIREQACKALIDAFVRQVDAAGLDDSDSVTIFECRDTMKYAAEQVINPREAK
ncbi:TPA: hypothetical protein U2J86_004722 [Serratia marcescens]|nr:hypothetical protein [Serratia marcescens]